MTTFEINKTLRDAGSYASQIKEVLTVKASLISTVDTAVSAKK